MSLSLLRFFFIVMDSDNVIAILFHILMRHITDINIFFFSDLFSLFFFLFTVNKYHHRRCIWSDAKITWAKQSEKKDHLPKERKILLLWIDDTTSGRTYVRDYKSNENTIYSKRSKSVWLIKTRWDEERKKKRTW
jgi:hypothetical protein